MCVILIGEVTKEQHKLALQQNKDGFSLFTADQGLVKCPTKAQVQQALGRFGIWHYRIATSGMVDAYNVHPFKVCNGKYLLYHNGVLGNGLEYMSDTHALAETLQKVSHTTAVSVLEALSDGNRFVLADAKDPHKFQIFGKWACDAGVLMSHKLVQPYYASSKYAKWAGPNAQYSMFKEDET